MGMSSFRMSREKEANLAKQKEKTKEEPPKEETSKNVTKTKGA